MMEAYGMDWDYFIKEISNDFKEMTEKEFPELISVKPDSKYNNLKAINYLEIIPILLLKMQDMQKQIDRLNSHLHP